MSGSALSCASYNPKLSYTNIHTQNFHWHFLCLPRPLLALCPFALPSVLPAVCGGHGINIKTKCFDNIHKKKNEIKQKTPKQSSKLKTTSKKHESNTRVEGKNPCAKFPGEGSEKKEQVSEREGDKGKRRERERKKLHLLPRTFKEPRRPQKNFDIFLFVINVSALAFADPYPPSPPIHTFPPPLLCHCLQRFHVFEQRSFWDYFCATFRACEAKARSWSQSWVWLFDSFVE